MHLPRKTFHHLQTWELWKTSGILASSLHLRFLPAPVHKKHSLHGHGQELERDYHKQYDEKTLFWNLTVILFIACFFGNVFSSDITNNKMSIVDIMYLVFLLSLVLCIMVVLSNNFGRKVIFDSSSANSGHTQHSRDDRNRIPKF